MKMKKIMFLLTIFAAALSNADQTKGIQNIYHQILDFELRHPKLKDSRGDGCALKYKATLAGGSLRLEVALTGNVPPFEVGFKSEMYQSLSFGNQGHLNAIVENSDSDGYGYWSTDRRSLEIWENSITLTVYDYQTKKTISQTCYSIDY